MGQRSTLCTHQMLNLDSEPSDSGLHSDHSLAGNVSDYANRNSHQVLSGPTNTVAHVHQSGDYHERVMFYENQYNTIPNCHAYQNIGLGAAGPSNFYNANMLLAPSARIFPVHQNDMMAEELTSSISQAGNETNMDGYNRHNQLVDSDGVSSKRKTFEVIPGISYNLNGSASSSLSAYHSLNYRLPQWGHSYDYVPGVTDPSSLTPLDYGRRAYLPGAEGSHMSIRSRSVATNIHPQPAFLPHQNCLLPGSYMMHPFQDLTWFSHVGNRNNFGDGNSIWNYNNDVRYLQGSGQISETLQMGNVNFQAYTSSSSGTNSALHFHPSSIPNFHPTLHNLQVHSYSHHSHIPASHQHPVNNLHHVSSNHSGDVMDVGSTFPHFPAGVDHIYRPRQLPQPAQLFSSGSMRFLSSEDDALMDLPGFYEVGNANDQHHDMRLDIDDMSYEDLLALEEQIGAVKTGLGEECIMKNLKTRIHVPRGTAFTSAQSARSFIDYETCSVCQVEYEENDIIGTLDCGHAYHADCIKQWLLIKNLCPICKTAALATKDKGELK